MGRTAFIDSNKLVVSVNAVFRQLCEFLLKFRIWDLQERLIQSVETRACQRSLGKHVRVLGCSIEGGDDESKLVAVCWRTSGRESEIQFTTSSAPRLLQALCKVQNRQVPDLRIDIFFFATGEVGIK